MTVSFRGLIALGASAAIGACVAASAGSSPGWTLSSLRPTPPAAGWKSLTPPSHSSVLWYPPSMQPVKGDSFSVSAALKSSSGMFLVYLNGGPSQGNPTMSGWASFRLDHLREERNSAVHNDGFATGIAFRGGTGSCVVDDYLTRVGPNHYKEVDCLVHGKTTPSVIVAATLANVWPRYQGTIESALEAWQVR